MRHVYPTTEIPHLWAHQTQDDARNPQGNLYFRGATIYSYRDSWPLGHIHTKGRGKKAATLVLLNSDTYSSTTAGHQSSVSYAANHMPRCACPYPCAGTAGYFRDEHEKNLVHFAAESAQRLAKAQRAMQVSTVQWYRESAETLHAYDIAYRKFFGIRKHAPLFPAAEWAAASARAQAIENPDPVRDAKRFKERERRVVRTAERLERLKAEYVTLQAQAAASVADGIEAWRAGGAMPNSTIKMPDHWTRADRRAVTGQRYGYYYMPVSIPCMLRVSGEEIETSRGARIPLDHAPRIWRLVSACVSTGREYVRNGHTEHAGNYAIDKVSADGTLRAGCHTIPYAELERMAAQLGYTGKGA